MSTDRQATLKLLLRAIALSEGDFALLLARCNSIEVRDRLVADVKAQLGCGLYDRHVTDADRVVNLVDILDEADEGTQVISVTGLEASPHLHDILALANNAREEFRKRFKFPLVLWVTDEVDAQLRRRSRDRFLLDVQCNRIGRCSSHLLSMMGSCVKALGYRLLFVGV